MPYPTRPTGTAGRAVAAVLLALVVTSCGTLDELIGRTARPTSMPGPSGLAWGRGPAAPLALTEVAAAAHEGRIWVAGGLDAGGRAVDAVHVLDPATGAWSPGPALPGAVHHAALVSDGEALRLVGGYAGNGFDRPTEAVHLLRDRAWAADAPLPEPRAAGAAAWDGARSLVYAGGVGPHGVTDAVLALVAGSWETIGRLSEAREHLAATADGDGRVFVLGGRRGGLDGNLATVDVVEAGAVRRLAELPTPRGGVAAFFWPSLGACLVGGEGPGGTNAEVECLALDGSATALPDLGVARHGLGAAVVDGTVYVLLGGPQPGLFVSDAVERLDLP